MYHFEKKSLKNLEIFEKKMGLFEKVTRKTNAPSSKNFFFKKWLKGSMPLVQRLFFIWKFFSLFFFLERFGNLEIFLNFFCFIIIIILFYIYIYTHTQTKLIKYYMKILNSKKHKNME